MEQNDTVKLLRECDAGLRMGSDSLGEMLDYVKDKGLRQKLLEGKSEHERLISEVEHELAEKGAHGKEPAVMAKSMSWIKTNVKLATDFSDSTVADLVYDGCFMGMKSLHRYKNQYVGADDRSKELTNRILNAESRLTEEVQAYL